MIVSSQFGQHWDIYTLNLGHLFQPKPTLNLFAGITILRSSIAHPEEYLCTAKSQTSKPCMGFWSLFKNQLHIKMFCRNQIINMTCWHLAKNMDTNVIYIPPKASSGLYFHVTQLFSHQPKTANHANSSFLEERSLKNFRDCLLRYVKVLLISVPRAPARRHCSGYDRFDFCQRTYS